MHRSIVKGSPGVREDEAEGCVLSPVTIVAVGVLGGGEEGAVAAVTGFEEGDVRVGFDDGACLGGEADEGVVAGVDEERGDGDAIEHARGGGAVVVVVCGLKAGVECGDAVVELAQRADAGGAWGSKARGKSAALRRKRLRSARRNLRS